MNARLMEGLLTRCLQFTVKCALALVCMISFQPTISYAQSIALTFDDGFHVSASAEQASIDNASMLAALKKYGIHSMLFPTGTALDNKENLALVKAWGMQGHVLGNHTFSHSSLSQIKTDEYLSDILRAQRLLEPLKGWCPWLRYPYLDEGSSPAQRNQVLQWLSKHGYGVAAVTVTLPDWEYAARYDSMLQNGSPEELSRFRNSYVDQVLDEIKKQRSHWINVIGRDLPQTLLLHTNRLNAEILPVLLARLKASGWTFIDPEQAYADPVYQRRFSESGNPENTTAVLQNPVCH